MLKVSFSEQSQDTDRTPLWLISPENTIGSADTCTITLEGEKVSPQHATLHIEGDNAFLSVSDQTFPTQLNHQPIVRKTKLNDGDTIVIGEQKLTVFDPKNSLAALKQKTTAFSANANSRDVESHQWQLFGLEEPVADICFQLNESQELGRESSCDLVLKQPVLSRKHARIEILNDCLLITDLDSSNGTYLNNQRVKPDAQAKPGDIIAFEKIPFLVKGPVREINQTVMAPSVTLDDLKAAAEKKQWDTKPVSVGNRHNTEAMKAITDEYKKEDKMLSLKGGLIISAIGLTLVVAAFIYF